MHMFAWPASVLKMGAMPCCAQRAAVPASPAQLRRLLVFWGWSTFIYAALTSSPSATSNGKIAYSSIKATWASC